LLAMLAIVRVDEGDEVREGDALAGEHRFAAELVGGKRREEREKLTPRRGEILRCGVGILRRIIARRRDRLAVESIELRRVFAEDAAHAHEVAFALEVAQVAGMLGQGKILIRRAREKILLARLVERRLYERRHRRDPLDRLG